VAHAKLRSAGNRGAGSRPAEARDYRRPPGGGQTEQGAAARAPLAGRAILCAMANPFARAKYALSAHNYRQLPPDQGAEVAFAGRSNAGKSSCLNALVQQNALARVSKTPGRTQQLVFFDVAPHRSTSSTCPATATPRCRRTCRRTGSSSSTATSPRAMRCRAWWSSWTSATRSRTTTARCSATPPSRGLPAHAVLTKADKLGRGAAANTLQAVRMELSRVFGDTVSVQTFSAESKQGVDEAAQGVVARWLGQGSDAFTAGAPPRRGPCPAVQAAPMAHFKERHGGVRASDPCFRDGQKRDLLMTTWRRARGARHRAREVRLPLDDLRPPTFDGGAASIRAARRPGALRLGAAGEEHGRIIALTRDGAASRSSPAASSSSPARRSKPSTTPAAKPTRTSRGEDGRATNSASASSAWASSRSGAATRCRGCPRAATRSCATTCRRSARSAST
jgi:GTP-binding protein